MDSCDSTGRSSICVGNAIRYEEEQVSGMNR